jgi:hypothetical protein
VPSPVGKWKLVAAGDQSAQRDNSCGGLLIEVHDGGACSVEVSEHADAAAEVYALAYSKLALMPAVQRLVHLVWLPPHLGRGIRPADPFGRRYGTGTVTVVGGVVTVRPFGVVTVAEMIGVVTVTVAATAAGTVGILGVETRTVGTRRFEGDSDCASAVAAWTDAGEACVAAWAPLTVEPPAGLE